MARLLVRLKLRLVGNRLHQGTQPAIGFVMAVLGGLLAAAVGFSALNATVDGNPDVVVLVLALLWLGWILVPALTFTADETLDPRRFQLLPLRHRQLVVGLLAAGAVGVGGIATLAAVSGAAVGAGRASGQLIAGLVALMVVVLLAITCIAWSRAVLTLLADVLGTRRGREIGAALGVALLIGLWLTPQLLFGGSPIIDGPDIDLAGPAELARWSPGGLGAVGVLAAADGRLLLAFAAAGGLLVSSVLALALWTFALGRLDRRAPARSTSRRASALYPPWLAWLPRSRTTAVSVRFLRSLVRDPRVRSQALGQLFLVVPMVAIAGPAGVFVDEYAPLMAAGLAFPFGLMASNQFALDGPALWVHEVTGADGRADMRGRDLAVVLLATPVIMVAAVALAAVSGGWSMLPAALLLAAGVLVLVLGASNLASVLLPVPVPERGDNLFGTSATGQGCINTALLLVVYAVVAALITPMIVPVVLVEPIGWRTFAAVLGLGYAVLGGWLFTRGAASYLRTRGPDLLEVIDWRRG